MRPARSIVPAHLAALFALSACAPARPAPNAPEPAHPVARDVVDAVDTVDASDASTAPDAANTLEGTPPGEHPARDSAAPSVPVDDLVAWLTARGVPATTAARAAESLSACVAVRVGAPAEEAVRCTGIDHATRGHGPASVYRVRAHARILAVRHRVPVALLDAVTTVQPLDAEDDDPHHLLDLALDLAADGLSVTLRDPGPGDVSTAGTPTRGCDAARSELDRADRDATDPTERRWNDFDRELIRRACAARGRWTWSSGRFVRTPPP